MEYHFSKKVNFSFDYAIERTIEELKKEGFGIICTIDMKETLKTKINVDFRRYTILGACSPRYAYEALLEENKTGVFLPCNVVVQEHENGEVEISFANPEEMMNKVESLSLKNFAIEVKESLQQILKKI